MSRGMGAALLASLGWSLSASAVEPASCSVEPRASRERAACVVLRDRALQRWDAGDLEGAVHALSLAFALFPDPRFSYNIAQLERKRGRCEQARLQYQRYLALEPGGPWVNDARAHLDELTRCTPAAGELAPDGPVLLSPLALPVSSPARLESLPSSSAAPGLAWQAVLPPALGAGALLSGVAGTLFYFDAQAARDDARAASGNYTARDERRRVEAQESLQRARGFGIAALVLGASAIASHWLLARGEPRDEGPFLNVDSDALNAGWSGRF